MREAINIGSYSEIRIEINRIEQRSITFLKLFSVFWFTILFFLFKKAFENWNQSIHSPSNRFFQNLVESFTLNNTESLLSYVVFLIILILISWVLISLSLNAVNMYKGEIKSISDLLEKKYNVLINSIRYGLVASILLVFYIPYVYFMDSHKLILVFNFFNLFVVYFVLVVLTIIYPALRISESIESRVEETYEFKFSLENIWSILSKGINLVSMAQIISGLLVLYLLWARKVPEFLEIKVGPYVILGALIITGFSLGFNGPLYWSKGLTFLSDCYITLKKILQKE